MSKLLSISKTPPVTTNQLTLESSGVGPIGFTAALIPFLKSTSSEAFLRQQTLLKKTPLNLSAHGYYDQVLYLFTLAWLEKRYQFNLNGDLITHWQRDKSN